MPYYEYQCNECDHRFEAYRKVTDPPLTRCPKCRGRVRKIFRPVGIIFKGSGFHVTDYPSKGRKERDKEETAKTDAAKEPARPGKESKE